MRSPLGFIRVIAFAAGLAAFGSSTQPSIAGTANTTFTVTVNVPTSCTIAATNMVFPAYTSGQGGTGTATSTVTANCALLTGWTIALSKGSAPTFTPRQMTVTIAGTTYTINYNLYTTVGNASIWGDGTGTTVTVSGIGLGINQANTVFGTMPAAQSAATATYSDTITATITF
jgi:spore coat protein U-like protein